MRCVSVCLANDNLMVYFFFAFFGSDSVEFLIFFEW